MVKLGHGPGGVNDILLAMTLPEVFTWAAFGMSPIDTADSPVYGTFSVRYMRFSAHQYILQSL